jgi:hypothetical protein
MAYIKNNWVDREGTTRYFETVDDDGALIFTPDYTQVTEMGTPVNADNMNHIEEGIAAGSFTKYDSMTTYAKNDLVTNIVDNELKVYKSLQDNNTSTLNDSSFWEEVEFSGGGTGLQMFDTILKDHILTYEESKGLALQGTYVYKEALAGSRYGYPDFYNKCLEEQSSATATEVTLGSSTITMYVASNGHQYYDIANKDVIDTFFNTMGSAWFYGVDTENERIFLPRNNYFDQVTSDISEVGKSVEAGLPNITGDIDLIDCYFNGGNGALYNRGANATRNTKGSATTSAVQYLLGFDASRSNPIYGNSDTVQPNAVKKLLYICVGNTTNYEGMTEVVNHGMEILEQVAQKVNVDGTNLNNEGKSLFAGYAMPSNKYIDLTLGASGTTYTAPANGYFCLDKSLTTGNGEVYMRCVENLLSTRFYAKSDTRAVHLFLPIKKNNTIVVTYTDAGKTNIFRFIYAEGEQ